MNREQFAALPQARLGGVRCEVVEADRRCKVSLDSPAIEVMTDLTRVPAASIGADTALPDAHRAMILHGVRMLLVTDAHRLVVGLLSAADLLGERPVRVGRERGLPMDELTVASVMTPLSAVEAVELSDVMRAEVGHVVATLRGAGRQHALVVERGDGGRPLIRGVFSASQIARQMGEPLLVTGELARNFAEIEAAIAA